MESTPPILRQIQADERIGIPKQPSRYGYDSHLLPQGWQQYDTRQDAPYFGVWVNIKERRIFSYTEGDRSLVECPDDNSFQAELNTMETFYGPQPPMAVGYNNAGQRVEYYDKRPSVN